ncbi:lipase family protein [Corynebacterium sp. USCH3]|uniref:lipase family protein n=1 Tax=Corynebacterium sp. USCH3 TaxID=3024840 RepID=UPI0030B31D77
MPRPVLSALRRLLVPAAALAVVGGGLVPAAGAVAAAPGPVGSANSVAGSVPGDLVDAGEPARPAAANEVAPDWSGLDVSAGVTLPDRVGVPVGEVALNPDLGLGSAGPQQRFVYSTVDQHGAVASSTAAVFLPDGPAPEGGWPVLAWAHGTVGLGDECTPSALPRGDRDAGYLNHWLEQGYAVVASDYVGMGTPGLMSYLNGSVSAANVIDSVAAARSLDSVGTSLSSSWAVIGQSQGGGAALHVAHAATQRSGELGLDYRGAVATGAPAYIEELVLTGSPSFPPVVLPTGLNVYTAYILAGFREAHPEIDLDSVLSEEGRQIADMAETACTQALTDALDGVGLSRAFTAPISSVPGLEPALRDYMATPTDGYDKPVFVGHGLLDMDVPSPIGVILNSQMWLNQFLGSNERVDVHWYPEDHSGAMVASMADSTPFLRSLFA